MSDVRAFIVAACISVASTLVGYKAGAAYGWALWLSLLAILLTQIDLAERGRSK